MPQKPKFPQKSRCPGNEGGLYTKKHSFNFLAKETFERLFKLEFIDQHTDPDPASENEDVIFNSNYDELQKSIEHIIPKDSGGKFTLEKELKLWKGNNAKRGDSVEKLYNALMTIQPTSSVSERVFSVASTFVTKIRNQLKMYTLDGLVFLKYYFLNKK